MAMPKLLRRVRFLASLIAGLLTVAVGVGLAQPLDISGNDVRFDFYSGKRRRGYSRD
jgi:hypothetical protein